MAPVPKAKMAKRKGKKPSSAQSSAPPQTMPGSLPLVKPLKRRAETDASKRVEPDTEVVFEDPFGDEYEVEDVDRDEDADPSAENMDDASRPVVFNPGKHAVADGETLVCDETAYDVFYRSKVEWPCMSFDFIALQDDGSYANMNTTALTKYPLSITVVMGTQADKPSKNKLVFIRMSNLHRERRNQSTGPGRVKRSPDSDDSDSGSSDDEDGGDDMDPTHSTNVERNGILQNVDIKTDATVNRIRVMPQCSNIVAFWSETGRVALVDATPALNSLHLDSQRRMLPPDSPPPSSVRPFFSTKVHRTEGFALDWSRVVRGRLLSGAMDGSIHLTIPTDSDAATGWKTVPDRYRGHKASVEDLQWSPNEADVFCSCSVDKSVRVWDVREYRRPALGIANAHRMDVNVIAWNRLETHLLASGGDDGIIKVWDLRSLKKDPTNDGIKPAAEFALHRDAVSSVQWHPTDASMLCAGSEDGTVSVWDLAVERDAEEEIREGVVVAGAEDLPPQLLFIHMGQKHVKDAQWHPACQSLIMSTAEDGLNVFQPSNIALSST